LMSIQILGLREYYDERTGKSGKKHEFFSKGWRAPSVPDLFKSIDTFIEQIPQEDRWNLYFTVADCFEEPGRKLKEQWVMPFDIDDIDVTKQKETIAVAMEVLGTRSSEVGVIF